MLALSVSSLSMSFGGDDILKDVSFSLNEGERLGIVGVNGAGKSTLFEIISGNLTPSDGNVSVSKGLKTALLRQNASIDADCTVLEEAFSAFPELQKLEAELEKAEKAAGDSDENGRRYLSLQEQFQNGGGYEYRGRAKGILKSLGLPEEVWNEKIAVLSGGQKTRLALACVLMRNDDIIMLDEPTNHLDISALVWLENHLVSRGKTVLVVSHDRYFLDKICTKILDIENGKAKLYNGNYSAFSEKKEIDREIRQHHYENQQKEIKRQEAYIEQQRRWNRERNIIAAESRQKMLDKLVREEKPDALPEQARMRFNLSGESGNDVLSVVGLSKAYPGKRLFENLSFEVKKRQRIIITGENGCGKSTLLKIIAGRLAADSGYCLRGANVTTAYYDQENRNLCASNTVLDELWNAKPTLTETTVRSMLALFLFKNDDVFKSVSVLSGGEKARLTLAKLMLEKMNVLLLDEPTNHLDIQTAEALEKAISEFEGTVIAVSHDRYFIKKLADKILYFEKSDAVFRPTMLDGFDEYIEKTEEKSFVRAEVQSVPSEQKIKYEDNKRDRAERRKNEKALERAKKEAEKIEQRLDEIEVELQGEAAFDPVRLVVLEKEKEENESRLLELYEMIEG